MVKMLQLALLTVALCASAVLGQDSIGCFVPGECVGSTYVGISIEEDATACLDQCHDELGCQYFTYYANEKACLYFISCSDLSDEGCVGCTSGDNECDSRQCDLPGLCDGKLVDFSQAQTQQLCIDECDKYEDCAWWSYNADEKFCLLSEDCAFLDASYESSLAGEKGCEANDTAVPDVDDFSKILLIGGYDDTGHIGTVDLIELDSDTNCPDIPDFPVDIEESIAEIVNNETWVCGGAGLEGGNAGASLDACWKYDSVVGNWTEEEPMTEARANHASLVWEDGTMWVLGGRNTGGGSLLSTDTFNGTHWEAGVDMPLALQGHCVAMVSKNFAIMTGGSDGQDLNHRNAYLFERESGNWTQLQNMIDGRSEHTCEIVDSDTRGLELIVAGGGTQRTSTDIFSFPTQSWRSGPILPKPTVKASTAHFGGSFLMFGGSSGNTASFYNDVLEYQVENETWVDRADLMMSTPKYDIASVAVNARDLGCTEPIVPPFH